MISRSDRGSDAGGLSARVEWSGGDKLLLTIQRGDRITLQRSVPVSPLRMQLLLTYLSRADLSEIEKKLGG